MTKIKYTAHIPGEKFQILDSVAVKLVKESVPPISQSGFAYVSGRNSVILQSKDMLDILQTEKNGGWSHSMLPKLVKKGWRVTIVPNQPLENEFKTGAVGITYIASADAYKDKDEAQDKTWNSDNT